ncbi:MAG: hypothetical protein ABSD13_13860 [Candidatus Korobacteraceae bacterium]
MKHLVKISVLVEADSRQEAERAAINKIAAGGYEDIEVLEQEATEDRAEVQRDGAIDSAIGDEGEEP